MTKGKFDMKCKIVLGLSSVLFLLLVSVAAASPEVEVYTWANRASYQPGGRGTLHITVKNDRTDAITIHNITVRFPWHSYVEDHWEGNITIKDIDEAIPSKGGTYSTEVEFSVPNDGRALWGRTAYIEVMTDKGMRPGSAYITVAPPATATNNLIIILIAIVLVCTGGIMAMVYWAMKGIARPRISRPP